MRGAPRRFVASVVAAMFVPAALLAGCSSPPPAPVAGPYSIGTATLRVSGDISANLTFDRMLPSASGIEKGWYQLDFASGSGPQTMLIVGAPFVGTRKTAATQLTISMRFPDRKNTVTVVSDNGDCSVTITTSTAIEASGTFSCRYVPVSGGRLVNIAGSFSARAKVLTSPRTH